MGVALSEADLDAAIADKVMPPRSLTTAERVSLQRRLPTDQDIPWPLLGVQAGSACSEFLAPADKPQRFNPWSPLVNAALIVAGFAAYSLIELWPESLAGRVVALAVGLPIAMVLGGLILASR